LESDGSFVVQVMVAAFAVMLMTLTFESTGAVVSVSVVPYTVADLSDSLPALSKLVNAYPYRVAFARFVSA